MANSPYYTKGMKPIDNGFYKKDLNRALSAIQKPPEEGQKISRDNYPKEYQNGLKTLFASFLTDKMIAVYCPNLNIYTEGEPVPRPNVSLDQREMHEKDPETFAEYVNKIKEQDYGKNVGCNAQLKLQTSSIGIFKAGYFNTEEILTDVQYMSSIYEVLLNRGSGYYGHEEISMAINAYDREKNNEFDKQYFFNHHGFAKPNSNEQIVEDLAKDYKEYLSCCLGYIESGCCKFENSIEADRTFNIISNNENEEVQ